MKTIGLVIICSILSCAFVRTTESRPETSPSIKSEQSSMKGFYSFKMQSIDGKEIDFAQYKGKKVLLVNTASKCGYTPQYDDLQQLHEKYGDKVTILGFPSNEFGGQEPGSNSEIASFCKLKFGVTFQLFSKTVVVGENQHPLYAWLSKKELNGWNDQAPKWNFCKYLVNENGELVKFFSSSVNPFDKELLDALEK